MAWQTTWRRFFPEGQLFVFLSHCDLYPDQHPFDDCKLAISPLSKEAGYSGSAAEQL
jgi:hypothetical protein